MTGPLLFLLKLAWESRYRIPLIITVGFMALDIRMQFEINIHMRRIRRRPQIVPDMNHIIDENRSDSDGKNYFLAYSSVFALENYLKMKELNVLSC